MLSYQHQYHAGNFADVHKHLILRILFESLLKKTKPFCFIDCHAGSGRYDLGSDAALKTGEYSNGIERLWQRVVSKQQPALAAYLDAISAINSGGDLRYYPGSPQLAQHWLRDQDKALLLELHPQAVASLRKNIAADSRISIHARDCYEGLTALVPPPIKRGLVLLDPSYEIKDEYEQIIALVKRAHQRWNTATYAIWYPILAAGRHHQLLRALKKSKLEKILISELHVSTNANDTGMLGSGLAIINTPWLVDENITALIPEITTALAPAEGSSSLRWLMEE